MKSCLSWLILASAALPGFPAAAATVDGVNLGLDSCERAVTVLAPADRKKAILAEVKNWWDPKLRSSVRSNPQHEGQSTQTLFGCKGYQPEFLCEDTSTGSCATGIDYYSVGDREKSVTCKDGRVVEITKTLSDVKPDDVISKLKSKYGSPLVDGKPEIESHHFMGAYHYSYSRKLVFVSGDLEIDAAIESLTPDTPDERPFRESDLSEWTSTVGYARKSEVDACSKFYNDLIAKRKAEADQAADKEKAEQKKKLDSL